jgi:ElaB/YqjD/DUF883 family membrane-anchored ribosome-binding protein
VSAYDAVLAPDVADRRDAYKKLQKEMATAQKKRVEVSKRSAEMTAEADKLFKSWEGSTAAIENPDLRQRSEQRLTRTKERFGEIRATGQNAAGLYEPFMKALQDQVTYLGHDLNSAAVASLKPEAENSTRRRQSCPPRSTRQRPRPIPTSADSTQSKRDRLIARTRSDATTRPAASTPRG